MSMLLTGLDAIHKMSYDNLKNIIANKLCQCNYDQGILTEGEGSVQLTS